MAGGSKLYLKEIYDRFSYLASWLPNVNMRLGDGGIQQGEEFKRITTLENINIPFEVRTSEHDIDFTYTSKSGVKSVTTLNGEVIPGMTVPVGQAGISIQFGNEGAFLFQAVNCSVEEVEDRLTLGNAIIRLFKLGQWDPGWGVVDTLVKSGTATIIVSNSRSAAIELTGKIPEVLANLTKLGGELTVSSQRGDIFRVIAAEGLTPLFRLSRIRQSLLSRLNIRSSPVKFGGPAPGAQGQPDGGELLEAVTPDLPE